MIAIWELSCFGEETGRRSVGQGVRTLNPVVKEAKTKRGHIPVPYNFSSLFTLFRYGGESREWRPSRIKFVTKFRCYQLSIQG